MDSIELIETLAGAMTSTVAKAIGERSVVWGHDELVRTFPFLGSLKAIRLSRLERAVELIQRELKAIDRTCDPSRLAGFVDIAFRYFEAGAREHRDLKLRILAAACTHCAEESNTDPFDKMLDFFESVERLQPYHFRILRYLEDAFTEEKLDGGHTHLKEATLDSVAQKLQFTRIDAERIWLVRSLVQLRDMGLIALEKDNFLTTNKGFTTTVTDPYQVIPTMPFGLTVFGCQLLSYVRTGIDGVEEEIL